jgi:four helix bundle protein
MILNLRNSAEWKRSMDLAIEVYRVTRGWPDTGDPESSVTLRMLDSATKIERRVTDSFHVSFDSQCDQLKVARYHVSETEFYLYCAFRLKYIDENDFSRLTSDTEHVRNLLNRRIQSLGERYHV